MTTTDFKIPETASELAQVFDHTLLKPDATRIDIEKLCQDAKVNHFYSVCVNPYHVSFCRDWLANTEVKTITVVGFPLGANTTQSKVDEAKHVIDQGAQELDMVINIGALKNHNFKIVSRDIQAVVVASNRVPVKVILENSLLTRDEIIMACKLSKEAGAAFIKTSTGFSTKGAVESDVALMRETVGPVMGVKASDGARTLDQALGFLKAGANRIGASASVEIMQEAKERWGA